MILIEHHVMVKVNNISRFFRDEIKIFSNLVVRDEIEICFFYISCFETRSRICFTTSRISRRGRETKQLILEVEREFLMIILARHFEIKNSRQCLLLGDAIASKKHFKHQRHYLQVPNTPNDIDKFSKYEICKRLLWMST